jgi:uncharacterized membrane protein YkvA (DUF1232 family)
MRASRTPFAAKFLAVVGVSYALSPMDVIPDFVPVLGYLDDMLLLPLGIVAVGALIPAPLMAELRDRAANVPPLSFRKAAAGVIVLLWVASAILAAWAFIALIG